MGVLRAIGEDISQQTDLHVNKSRNTVIFKKDGKYYEQLNGIEIPKDEVNGRTVISFEKPKPPIEPLRKAKRI